MKVRNKITIIIIAITFVFIFYSSIAFSNFFSNYLENQEGAQIKSISKSTESFFNVKRQKYQGSVNDYSHWDETYNFITNINEQEYLDGNLIEDTFINTDVNFIIFVGEDNSIRYEQYYDNINGRFTDFPTTFNEGMEKIIRVSESQGDLSSIMKLGDQFYFVASSDITDTNKVKKPIGRMTIGKLIDQAMIINLKEITDSNVSLSTIKNVSSEVAQELTQKADDSDSSQIVGLSKGKETIQIEYLVSNSAYEGYSVLMTITKTRDLFIGGMNKIKNFILIYTIIMIFLLFIIFTLLGRYISRPFIKLVNEVKGLDLTKNVIQRLETHGKDEFASLRNSINNMLSKIESEQYKVRESNEKLYATLSSVGDGVITVDRKGIVDFMNPIAQKLTGWNQSEFQGKTLETVFEIINEYTRERVENPVQKVFETEEIIELANHTVLISKDGLERAIEDTAAPIKDMFGKVIGVVLVFRDFSDKKEKRKQIEYLSYHDQLTGLYNRRFFEEELNRLDTKRNLPISFIFADVNGLKTINDAFGHHYGDLLIQQVSEVLKGVCRADDIIARTGGDEFIILLPKTEAAFVKELIKRIKEELEQKRIMDIYISVAFGWDTKDIEDQSVSNVLKSAEDHMYQKKIFDSPSKRSAVIKSILTTLRLKSPWEDAHSKRVSSFCEDIGKAYHLSEDEIEELRIAGELHDIGKIAIDAEILNKPSKLSTNEWAQIKNHPETGYRLLSSSSEYYKIAEYVLAHHEKWDGTGYPKGIKGEEIHWKARIIAIADAYDAMTCVQPHRGALSLHDAVEEIKKNAGSQFDPDVARTFVEKILGMTW